MNIEYYKQRLLDKERELVSDIARLEAEARSVGELEVRDSADDATIAQSTSESLEESALASRTLAQVRAALGRIGAGTFGKCIDSGRQIEHARLEAVPWAEYCLEEQEKHDRAEHVQRGGSTL